MDIKEYIDSGILELYVAGSLSDKENQEVHELMLKHPDIEREVLKIETTLLQLAAASSPSESKHVFKTVKEHIMLDNKNSKTNSYVNKKSKINWFNYSGWIASILFAVGLLWLGYENRQLTSEKNQLSNEINQLKTKISTNESDKKFLELEIEKVNPNLKESKELISILRDRHIIAVPLAGQAISLNAYAKIYWDKSTKTIYLDAQGLPEPPEGKVYQLWSLTLEPLTSKSLGTLNDFDSVTNKIFTLKNANASQAFGITLEPEGGSITPTLDQLYTLGIV